MNKALMQSYQYRAYDKQGHLVKGVERASSSQNALRELKKQGLTVVDLAEFTVKKEGGRVTLVQIEELTSQLSLLLRSGLTIDRALDVLVGNTTNTRLLVILQELQQAVHQGGELSSALEKHQDVFSTLYCEMVKIGESSGRLSVVFDKLAENLMFQRELSKKITQAMVYPLFILSVCLLALVAIFNFVVPSMSGLFESLTEVPFYTQALMTVSAWIQVYQFHLLFSVIGLIFMVIHSAKKAWFKAWLGRTLAFIPITRNALFLVERIRYSAAMTLMLESGVDLATAMQMAAKTVKNPGIASQLGKAQQEVSHGKTLFSSLASIPVFDSISLSLLQVGEETGQLGTVFNEVNRRSRSNFESWVLKLTAMLEPLMIVFMGLIVGTVVVIMLLSIVSVNDVSF